jgi:hypothetical protein
VISVKMDASAIPQIQERLTQLPPTLLNRVYIELRPLLQKALFDKLNDHFAGCGPKGGPTDPYRLTQRTSNLFWSVYRSLQVSEEGPNLKISIGSDLPYAAIHEYGGYGGRAGPYKKKDGRRTFIRPRPYLRPTINDLLQALPSLLEQAIQQVQVSK